MTDKTQQWQPAWINKINYPDIHGEITPFMFNGRFYRLENSAAFTRHHQEKNPAYRFHEDYFLIRDVESGFIISIPLLNHHYATAFVWNGEVFCFAMDYGRGDKKILRDMKMIRSKDLITWSAPQTLFSAESNEKLYNNSVVYDGKRFVMLYETNDPAYPPFTFKFAVSTDLIHWDKLDGALYGVDKYVGGPCMVFTGGYYYVTYVNYFPNAETGEANYDTRLARSKDLFTWEDAPANRSVLFPDYTHRPNPVEYPDVYELNASDAEFIELDGKVKVFWAGGNQLGVCDSYEAEYPGTLTELFESIFNQS